MSPSVIPIGLLCALALFAAFFTVYRVASRNDPTVSFVRVRVDTMALLCVCIGVLVLTVIALWQ